MGRDPMAAIPFLQHGPDPRRVHFETSDAKVPIAIERYRRLSEEAFAILDARLAKVQFLAGDEYSIADIATFAWVYVAGLCKFALEHHKNLALWCARIQARPAVQKGITIPEPAMGP
jgi:GST-like protein